ncbi:hypothetical protein AMS68_004285 [Peltaster fructicola]|uniref:ABC transporter n=1 Tax=Peltaster fructicola TaxID=286661 RepID=A0A6H0XVZ1_9PEZI|nr:hypothetical protein AMS68_004285 [Peltaster fructicola]
MQTILTADTSSLGNLIASPYQGTLKDICWSSPWDYRQAQFRPCFLPVLQGIPLVIITFHILGLLLKRRPQWLRPFIVEFPPPKVDDVLEYCSRARPSLCQLALVVLTGITFALQLARALLQWPAVGSLLSTATWLLLLTTLVVYRPRTLPLSAFYVILASVLSSAACLAQHTSPSLSVRAIDIATLISSIASVVTITQMPFRDPALPSKDISTPFTEPTSTLRSPEDNLTLWEYITVSWVSPLIKLASKRQLEDGDVWELGFEFQHKRLHERFREVKGTVISRLIQANGIDIGLLTFLGLLETTLEYAQPFLLERFLAAMQASEATRNIACAIYAALAWLLRQSKAEVGVLALWHGRRAYERSRGEMITMLYEKVLGRKISSLPSTSEEETNGQLLQESDDIEVEVHEGSNGVNSKLDTTPSFLSRASTLIGSTFSRTKKVEVKQPASMGKILNLMRNDVYEVAQRFWDIRQMVQIPLSIVFAAYTVVHFLGPAALLAIVFVVLGQLIILVLGRVLMWLEKHRRKATDDKLQIASQFVESIRHLRWYGWQDSWIEQIMEARQHELHWRIVTGLCNLLIGFINAVGLEAAPAIGFYAYTTVTGGPLSVDVGFPALQALFMLGTSLKDVPDLIKVILNAWVAVERIEDFMAEPNKDEQDESTQTGSRLALQNASFSWPGSSKIVLANVSLSFPPGLTVISGEVAAGKTALLQALLGELDMHTGSLIRPNEAVGYCAQSPWLQSMSIKDNILFSAPYNEQRYLEVLEACALLPDLAELPARDLSFIGENGIGLSGGQKARVALARAAYSDTKIMLLDDPLSALDQQTAESIVKNLFIGPLLQGRVIILVTHRLDLVAGIADQVLEIKASRVDCVDRADLQGDFLQRTTSKSTAPGEKTKKDDITASAAAAAKFIEDEHRAQGGVKASVYWQYIKAGSLWLWFILILLLFAYRSVTIYLNWFIKTWGEAYDAVDGAKLLTLLDHDFITTGWNPTDGLPPPQDDVRPWVLITLLIGMGRAVLGTAVLGIMLIVTYIAGKGMFKDIIFKVGHANFRFYDVTPVGRLMNRITSDAGVLDGNIVQQFHAIAWLLFALGSSILIVAFVTPVFLLFTAASTVIFVLIFRRFLPTSQNLRRLEMVSLTPLMSNFGELLNGLVTVRAFGAQRRFQDRVIKVVDTFQKMDHFYWSVQAWLMFRFDTLSAASTFILSILAVYTGLSAGLTAFVLLAANKFVRTIHNLCLQYGSLQMEFVSVERVVELSHLAQESEGEIKPPAWWPSFSGNIEFRDVTIKYAPHLDPALNGVSFTIKGGSKTAILGRTGSGKSTLALAMLATILPTSGQILVDNIDLAHVDKQALRTRVTFLAQDPVLFPGSMRQNLDPLEQHTPEECEAVLARVCERQGWSLTTQIEGGGRNLSQGQRQLVGLARAVLRRSAIIILDEATASIDLETSMQIQQVLHEEMKDSTVITIAHRLEAVSNADYCIVLGIGRVVKQGPAADLLEKRSHDQSIGDSTDDA